VATFHYSWSAKNVPYVCSTGSHLSVFDGTNKQTRKGMCNLRVMLLSQLTLAYLEDQFVGFFLAIPDADALGSSLMVEEHGDMIGGTLACHVF
jgi:hypothetical protein